MPWTQAAILSIDDRARLGARLLQDEKDQRACASAFTRSLQDVEQYLTCMRNYQKQAMDPLEQPRLLITMSTSDAELARTRDRIYKAEQELSRQSSHADAAQREQGEKHGI
ncbi:Uncharacterized protein PBTT_09162 [Plasmodiophora brassicae]